MLACIQPNGYVVDDTDCDDTSSVTYPFNTEICDGVDNDCDGRFDEGNVCQQECIAEIEVCDTLDNDCDGDVDEGVQNGCGLCGQVEAEVCDGVDNDCDGQTDEGTNGSTHGQTN